MLNIPSGPRLREGRGVKRIVPLPLLSDEEFAKQIGMQVLAVLKKPRPGTHQGFRVVSVYGSYEVEVWVKRR